jgi:uncharacterized protein (DUF488 family)
MTMRAATSIANTVHVRALPAKQLPLSWSFRGDSGVDEAREPEGSQELAIFTVGHSNQDVGSLLELLQLHRLATIVDVRSTPYSRFAPQFNRDMLAAALELAGLRYVWAGETLGGRPRDPACYRDGIVQRGHVDYQAMARQGSYQRGVNCLLQQAEVGRTAVMCSEEDPRRCHRHHLIATSLQEQGVVVWHIRGDGSLEPSTAVVAAPEPRDIQLSLFAEAR